MIRHTVMLQHYILPMLLSVSVALLSGCATPITVDHVDLQTSYSISLNSALSSDSASDASSTVLRKQGLLDKFEQDPVTVLAELHKNLKADDEDQLFALAELSFLHAKRSHDRNYFLASAVYAWALLFPEGAQLQLHPSDLRFRQTYDLYNQALAKGFAASGDAVERDEVKLKSGTYQLPFGTLEIAFDESGLFWGGYKLDRFISTNALEVDGLRNRYHRSGIGVPLAASLAKSQTNNEVKGSDRLGQYTKVPVTALLRLDNARHHLKTGKLNGRLEVYAADKANAVIINGQRQPMESDSSAALAYQLNDSPLYAMEIANFLHGGIFTSGMIPKDRAQDGIFMLQPYKVGKIPLVLVHGTASSPARWAEMVNEFNGDPNIREHYQIWVFIYDSGNPIPYSGGRLRKALTDTIQELDPQNKDAALQQMVVIGHSQGGLLTKTTVIDNGTKFWDRVAKTPFEQTQIDAETKDLLKQSLFYKPLPFVKRVVFISTPHHGAMLAAYQIVTGLASKLLTMPMRFAHLAQATVAGDSKLTEALRNPPTAIDNMNPDNPGLKLLASIPITAVPAHSIIAVEGDGPKEQGDDGVVAYNSAHIDEAQSEFLVRWNHSCQGQPEVIEEVRRILFEHLAGSGIKQNLLNFNKAP